MGRQTAFSLIVAAGLGLGGSARAVPLQSDDFKSGLGSFWKVHQILRDTDAGNFGPATAEASGGMLKMTSESQDIWNKKFQPFLVYQENITGAFDIRIQAISHNGTDSWSGAGGLMLLQNVPDTVIQADPTTYPSHWMIDATNGHGPEDKGGGQQQSRENELLDLGTGTPLQPPYWLRVLRIGDSLWRYYSTDGGKSWLRAGPRIDLGHIRNWTGDTVKPIRDPIAVGVVQQAHDGPGAPVTATLGPFQATSIPTGTIAGSVIDATGKPIPRATFRAIATGSADIPAGTDLPITTDDQGRFSEELAPGDYTLAGDATGRALSGFPMTVTVTAGQTATIPTITAGDMPPFFETGTGSRVQDDFGGVVLGSQWTNTDIGDAGGSSGMITVANGKVTIAAGGSGIGTDTVGVGYNGTLMKVSGDFAATLQVLAVPDNQDNEFGGLVATTGTDPFAAFAQNLITPQHPIEQWVRPIAAADPIATLVPNTQGSTILPAWLKIRRVGDTVAYWWTKDPNQGTPVFGGVDQAEDFNGKDLLVGLAASGALDDGSIDPDFQFAHFQLVPLGN
jgi:hypothetical protein